MKELVESQSELRPGRIGLVVNRCPLDAQEDWDERARQQGLELLGTIPEDPILRDMDREGESLLDLPSESDALRGIGLVLAKLGLT
jgi:CO dehydrogenase maturation factor